MPDCKLLDMIFYISGGYTKILLLGIKDKPMSKYCTHSSKYYLKPYSVWFLGHAVSKKSS